MTRSDPRIDGRVASLWRYPVKSMLGEELTSAQVDDRGVLGDRAYAVLDRTDGKVATAKNPRTWPELFRFQGALADPVRRGARTPPARVTLPDGTALRSDQADVDQVLSRALGREVTLVVTDQTRHEDVDSALPKSWAARSEEYWPDMEGLEHRDTVTDFDLPEGTFFDCAVVHVLTTATLGRLRTAARHNGVHVGVYASVLHGGRIQPGDPVTVQ